MKNLLYRILAIWALLIFALTLLLVAIILLFLGPGKEPGRTTVFIKISRVWISTFFFLTGCSIRIKGKENFRKGQVYIVTANHNSFMDVLALSPFVPGTNKTIAKAEMAKIPIFGMIYRRGSVLVNRKAKESRAKSYLEMVHVLKMGIHMCIYPEGTRNRTNQPLKEFHDGAFRLACETQTNIIPTVIFNSKNIIPADKGLYFKPGRVEMHFLPEVNYSEFPDYNELKQEVHRIMEEYILKNEKRN